MRRSDHCLTVPAAALISLLFVLPPAFSDELVSINADTSGSYPVGTASCGTTTCHGNVVDRGPPWNHSLTTFNLRDPHSTAGQILRRDPEQLGAKIVFRLDPQAQDDDQVYASVLRTRCISCHTSAGPGDCRNAADDTDLEALLQRGVDCESCHGTASGWLEPHTLANFSGAVRFSKQSGLADLESIVGQSQNCLRCHVGSRVEDGVIRDVNHDLIAAGHPALRFDLITFRSNLPKHWSPDSIGEQTLQRSQVAVRQTSRKLGLIAATELSHQRATARVAGNDVPWPELADYDCFACHQNLSMRRYDVPLLGQTSSPLRISDGLPIWNPWYAARVLDLRANPQWLSHLSPGKVRPQEFAQLTGSMLEKLRDDFDSTSADGAADDPNPMRTLRQILNEIDAQIPPDWHTAASQFLMLQSSVADLRSAGTLELADDILVEIELCLRFDRSGSSPARFDPQTFRNLILQAFSFVDRS